MYHRSQPPTFKVFNHINNRTDRTGECSRVFGDGGTYICYNAG
ncbi:hypothetical protein A2U01_0036742 [Trifolium medium]|uniref:Uncharacterized protein n=1 Tax=Trifolium medium TaxID=97028 RepID=A0A392PUV5_9FABA|nr:hypothetical protein [Trifolium medium]